MVTKPSTSLRTGRNTAFLLFFPTFLQVSRPAIRETFPACPGIFCGVVQIFDNLVGRKYLLRQNSGFLPGEILTSLTISNESLIPAQNQRWRRA